jgi:hypothetical protein
MIILDMDNQTPAQPTEDVEVIVGKYKIKVIRKSLHRSCFLRCSFPNF